LKLFFEFFEQEQMDYRDIGLDEMASFIGFRIPSAFYEVKKANIWFMQMLLHNPVNRSRIRTLRIFYTISIEIRVMTRFDTPSIL
jgi:hypothetical protein